MSVMKHILLAKPYVRNIVFGGILLILGALLSGISQAHAKYASFVMDADTGQILHQTNANTRNYPASLTKMMTVYMLFEALEEGKINKKTKITFSKRAANRPSTNLKVSPGYKITVEQAIKALIVRSANDVATAVAEHLGGSEAKFARMMTKKARSLGMKRSNFKNASGLPNRAQLSTAKDMATLVLALQNNYPQHYHYFSSEKFTYSGTTYKTHNKLLRKYNGSDGVKTGYTRASGFNIATSVERNGHRLIGVVFGGKSGKSRDRHMRTLLDKSFAKLQNGSVVKAPVVEEVKNPVVIVEEVEKVEVVKAPIAEEVKNPVVIVEEVKKVEVAKAEPEVTPKPVASNSKKQDYFAPLLPENHLTQTVIMNQPKSVSLVQDYRTGNPKYDGGGWSVQVGAYYKLSKATQFFSDFLPSVKGRYESVILSRASKKGSIYKPRLVGMRKAEAYNICKQLKAQKLDCLVISPYAS